VFFVITLECKHASNKANPHRPQRTHQPVIGEAVEIAVAVRGITEQAKG
jgi:hypothetical protein